MRKKQTIPLFLDALREDPNAVYVGTLEYPFSGMIMSHLASPNLEELHKMVDAIGVPRKHFQDDEKHLHPHYDICKSKKALAIKLGAVEIDDRELIERCYPQLKKLLDEDILK
jgi:hypothetical protein